MEIKDALFLSSTVDPDELPANDLEEFAFIGRSNVGKSSLINVICNKKKMAKIGSVPGKTRQLNYFLINEKILNVYNNFIGKNFNFVKDS